MTKALNNQITNINNHTQALFWMLATILATLLVAYVYFMQGAIFATIKTESLTKEIKNLTSVVGDLETQYVEAKKSITLASALNTGFVEVKGNRFVTVGDSPRSVSLNHEI